jgi:hypothetical protein
MQATPRDLRLGRTKKCNLAALLAVVVILTAGNRAPAADTIEELLQQDEASGQNELRPDLNAFTEAEWEYYFKVVKHSDTQLDSQLVERESETPRRVIYIWAPAAIAAGFGMAICAIMAWPSMRRVARTLMVPVQMEDLNFTIAAYAGHGDGRP